MTRPSEIDDVIVVDDDRHVTIFDRVVEVARRGGYIEECAAAAGRRKQTIYNWQRTAARASIRVNGQPLSAAKLTQSLVST